MEFGLAPLRNDAAKRIEFTPEYVHGYSGGRNNILKFANRKVIYPVDNLVVVYDLLDRVQSIFAQHLNEVTLVRCRESGRTVLSAEESNNNVRIYLWDKQNFKILAKIKIKKKNFLDIEFLNDGDIFLLCKWAGKLVCLVLSVENCRDRGVHLSLSSVCVVKVGEGYYGAAPRRRRQNGETDDGGNGGDAMAGEATKRSNPFRLVRKKRAKNDTHIIANRRAKGATPEKSYFRKVTMADAANFVQVKDGRKGGHPHYDISFLMPFVKERKRSKRLLAKFGVSVPIGNNVCIYNGEYMLVYVMKNGILYERLRSERVSSASFLNGGSFSKAEQGLHFFSFLSMDLFMSGSLLCDLSGEVKRDESHGGFPVWTDGSVSERIIWEGDSPNEGPITKEAHLNMIKCVTNRLDNFLGDEISAIAVVTCLCVNEGDDIDVVLKLQRRVHHGERDNTLELRPPKGRSVKKSPSRRKKILVVGTKQGVIIIVDFRKPHRVEHLRKFSTERIVSIFTHQNWVVVLSSSGVLHFLGMPNYETSKSVDIFCSWGGDSSSVNSSSLSTTRGTSDWTPLGGRSINSFRGSPPSSRSGVQMGNNPTRSYTEQKGKGSSVGLLSSSVRISPTMKDKESRRIICASCLLDIYTLVLGTSNDEMVLHNLISNETCPIYPNRQKINCFTLDSDHVFYNVERCLYKMSLVQYNSPVKVVTLTEGPISSFVFLSSGVLICGTVRGSLCFFAISEGRAKVINKVPMKEFASAGVRAARCVSGIPNMSYIPTIHGGDSPFGREHKQKNDPKENPNEVICSIGKVVPNWRYPKRRNFGRMNEVTSRAKQISWLVLNKARNILLCATERCIYLFRIHVGGNEKVDLRYLRCLHFERTIVHVNLVQKYDNLFYVAVREGIHNTSGGNRYSYHLCSFSCAKSRRVKMIDLCRNVLLESTRLCPFLHPREGRFGLLKDKVVFLLNPYTFAVYSCGVRKTTKRDQANTQRGVSSNISCVTSWGELTIGGKNDSKEGDTVCPFRNAHIDISLFWKSRKTDRSGPCKSTIRQGAQRILGKVAKREPHTEEDNYKAPLRKDHSANHKPKCEATLKGSPNLSGENKQVKERQEEFNGRKMKDYTKYKLLRNILQKRTSLNGDGFFLGPNQNGTPNMGQRYKTHLQVPPGAGHEEEEKNTSPREHRGYIQMNEVENDNDGSISNRCNGDTIDQSKVTGRTTLRRWSPEDSVKKYLRKYLGVCILHEGEETGRTCNNAEEDPDGPSAGDKQEKVYFPLSEGVTGKVSTRKSHIGSRNIQRGTRIQGISVKPLGGDNNVGRTRLKGKKTLVREKALNGDFPRGISHSGVRCNDRGDSKRGTRSCTSAQACDKREVCVKSEDALRGGRAPIDDYTGGINKDVVKLNNHTQHMFDREGGNANCNPCCVKKGEKGPSTFSTTNQKKHPQKICRMTTQNNKIKPGKAPKHAVLRQMGRNIQSGENGEVKYPLNMCKIREKEKVDGEKTLVDDRVTSPRGCTNVYIKAPFAINSIEIVPDHR
ncbi:Uncharacterized protein PCOAH_00009510 [Plasmodium coatneyi]|uniref:WD repeat-containing protein n=1 Tax=Plasmodium coatneyi TaxID=208452 RepID=A0A1B1DUD7_9APIC|nr:Uncharacterized protein PCOAH_00009510 [Plasmodium coatneyi]ANQ06354.1 Uncharacterized protein PCOAH_00009510 [Plasmodium coatneyi]